MPNAISGSVGDSGGQNHPEDVRTVYALFNKMLSNPLAVSDQVSEELIAAIRDFQSDFLSRPDGRIDVGGRTWRELLAATADSGTEITGSVGQGGQNRSSDVRIVYALFNNILADPLTVSDQCSAELIQTIKAFQQPFLSRPDGRIDVGGRTWRELTAAAERPETGEISGSVGQGGRNRPQDVRIVYALLNKILSIPLAVSEQVSDQLIRAIKDVQKTFMSRPDGRIDVGGRTWRRLTIPAGGTGKAVLLSFDDGPAPTGPLHSILDTLDRYNIKAEFYVLGQEVDSYPAAVKEIAERGHRVQNHSYTHPNLAGLSKATVRKELERTQESIRKAAGVTPTKIR
ncbi:MAG: hypothetical protein D3922_10980, partial [Candidatus Electrothrix sp. AR1]|nr:hypothetical protein [Candidatus Electrothrix sp. AR1]